MTVRVRSTSPRGRSVVRTDPTGVLKRHLSEEHPTGVDGHDEEDDESAEDDGHLDQRLPATVGPGGTPEYSIEEHESKKGGLGHKTV